MNTVNLLVYDLPRLSEFFVSLGEKPFRAQQVMKWIHQRGISDFEAMTDLSKDLRQLLQEKCTIEAPEIVTEQVSRDGTHKWLLKVDNANHIETVFIPEANRGTLCISSQVGCALNCTFCSTATQGFNRNLTVSEIIGQVWLAKRRLLAQNVAHYPHVTNIVMMGMGEPLLNFDAVVSAISIMRHDYAYGLSRRRVTLSTSGVVPGIDRLKAVSDVSLAVSLHAPNNALRNQLVPLNKKYPIEMLLDACHRYVEADQKRHITIEYAMLKGVNDHLQHAKELARLLNGLPCKVNLIPFNPFPGAQYERSSFDVIQRFSKIVSDAGLVTTVRKTRGDDIAAACGQLVGKISDRTKRHQRFIEVHMTDVHIKAMNEERSCAS